MQDAGQRRLAPARYAQRRSGSWCFPRHLQQASLWMMEEACRWLVGRGMCQSRAESYCSTMAQKDGIRG
jgi:hypothetical protein